MRPEEQRIAIAEACGWKPDDDGAGINTWEASWVRTKLYGLRPTFRADGTVASYTADCLVPDYLNDLNAMHEARKILTRDQQVEYAMHLGRIVTSHMPASRAAWMDYAIANADASQHAEAFLKTLNLWKP
jgi:hypothetical protein